MRAIDLAPGDYDKVDLLWDLEEDVAWTDRAVRDGRRGRRWFRCLTFFRFVSHFFCLLSAHINQRLVFMIFDVHLLMCLCGLCGFV
jgi:hypothetical protein